MILLGTQYYYGQVYFYFVHEQGETSRMLMAIGLYSTTIDSTSGSIYITPSAFANPVLTILDVEAICDFVGILSGEVDGLTRHYCIWPYMESTEDPEIMELLLGNLNLI